MPEVDWHKLTAGCLQCPDWEAVCWYVADFIVDELGFEDCVIYQAFPLEETLTQIASAGDKQAHSKTVLNPLSFSFGHGITGHVASTKRPVCVGNTELYARYVPDVAVGQSELCVPILTAQQTLLGLIDSESSQAGRYGPAEQRLFESIAQVMALSSGLHHGPTDANQDDAEAEVHSMPDAAGGPHKNGFAVEDVLRADSPAQYRKNSEALERLSAGIAHDFNNNLAVVRGNVELIRLRENCDHKFLDEIEKATDRCVYLIEHLLSLSRQQTLDLRVVNVVDILNKIQLLLQRTLGEWYNIKLVYDIGSWNVQLDPNQMENALINLAVNARDAMPEGGQITIACNNVVIEASEGNGRIAPGEYVQITVLDDGEGMNEETLARASEPFFTTKGAGAGSGLGLSMVREFIEQCGGHFSIQSAPGKGTTVEMTVPRVRAKAVKLAVPNPSHVPYGSGETILIVENERHVAQTTVKLLEQLDYVPVVVNDPRPLLEDKENLVKPHLVLCDVILDGGVRGPDIMSKLFPSASGVPVIYMSGFVADVGEVFFIRENLILLRKPFSLSELATAIHAKLDPIR